MVDENDDQQPSSEENDKRGFWSRAGQAAADKGRAFADAVGGIIHRNNDKGNDSTTGKDTEGIIPESAEQPDSTPKPSFTGPTGPKDPDVKPLPTGDREQPGPKEDDSTGTGENTGADDEQNEEPKVGGEDSTNTADVNNAGPDNGPAENKDKSIEDEAAKLAAEAKKQKRRQSEMNAVMAIGAELPSVIGGGLADTFASVRRLSSAVFGGARMSPASMALGEALNDTDAMTARLDHIYHDYGILQNADEKAVEGTLKGKMMKLRTDEERRALAETRLRMDRELAALNADPLQLDAKDIEDLAGVCGRERGELEAKIRGGGLSPSERRLAEMQIEEYNRMDKKLSEHAKAAKAAHADAEREARRQARQNREAQRRAAAENLDEFRNKGGWKGRQNRVIAVDDDGDPMTIADLKRILKEEAAYRAENGSDPAKDPSITTDEDMRRMARKLGARIGQYADASATGPRPGDARTMRGLAERFSEELTSKKMSLDEITAQLDDDESDLSKALKGLDEKEAAEYRSIFKHAADMNSGAADRERTRREARAQFDQEHIWGRFADRVIPAGRIGPDGLPTDTATLSRLFERMKSATDLNDDEAMDRDRIEMTIYGRKLDGALKDAGPSDRRLNDASADARGKLDEVLDRIYGNQRPATLEECMDESKLNSAVPLNADQKPLSKEQSDKLKDIARGYFGQYKKADGVLNNRIRARREKEAAEIDQWRADNGGAGWMKHSKIVPLLADKSAPADVNEHGRVASVWLDAVKGGTPEEKAEAQQFYRQYMERLFKEKPLSAERIIPGAARGLFEPTGYPPLSRQEVDAVIADLGAKKDLTADEQNKLNAFKALKEDPRYEIVQDMRDRLAATAEDRARTIREARERDRENDRRQKDAAFEAWKNDGPMWRGYASGIVDVDEKGLPKNRKDREDVILRMMNDLDDPAAHVEQAALDDQLAELVQAYITDKSFENEATGGRAMRRENIQNMLNAYLDHAAVSAGPLPVEHASPGELNDLWHFYDRERAALLQRANTTVNRKEAQRLKAEAKKIAYQQGALSMIINSPTYRALAGTMEGYRLDDMFSDAYGRLSESDSESGSADIDHPTSPLSVDSDSLRSRLQAAKRDADRVLAEYMKGGVAGNPGYLADASNRMKGIRDAIEIAKSDDMGDLDEAVEEGLNDPHMQIVLDDFRREFKRGFDREIAKGKVAVWARTVLDRFKSEVTAMEQSGAKPDMTAVFRDLTDYIKTPGGATA